MRQVTESRLTLDEFLNYDNGTDTRYELVNGVLADMGAESTINTLIAGFLFLQFVGLGIASYRIGFKQWLAISDSTARDPDLIVHSEASFAAIDGAAQALLPVNVQPPILVVEIVSPGDQNSNNYKRDYIDKRQEYASRGIPEYWLVDPSRGVVIVMVFNGSYYETREFRGNDWIISVMLPMFQLTAQQVLGGGR